MRKKILAKKAGALLLSATMLLSSYPSVLVYADNEINITGENEQENKKKNTPILKSGDESGKTDCELSSDEINIEYGEQDIDINNLGIVSEDYDGTLSIGLAEETDVITIVDNKINAVKPGVAAVKITAAETENFAGAEVTTSVIVGKKNLGEVSASDITWNIQPKKYDATKSIEAGGIITESAGVINNDMVAFDAVLQADSANAGERTTTIDDYTITSGDDKYEFSLPEDEKAGPVATIQKADAEISLDEQTVVYGDSAWSVLKEGAIPESWKNWIHADCIVASDEIQEELNSLDVSPYVSLTVNENEFAPGTVNNAIHYQASTTEHENWNFTGTGDVPVTVLNQTQTDNSIWDNIEVDKEKSWNAYTQDNSSVWVAPGGRAAFKIKGLTDLYDKIIFDIGNGAQNDAIDIPQDADGDIEGDVQFGSNANASILSDADDSVDGAQANKIPSGKIKIDKNAPEVEFQDSLGTYTSLTAPEFSELAMVKFRNEGYTATIKLTDNESGIDSATYKLIKVSSQEDAENKLLSNASGYESWNSLDASGKIEVPGTDEGYWLILVGVKDRVGNASVVSSNGITIDTTAPSISIDGIDESTIYDEDVKFTINTNDKSGASGIAKIKVTAKTEKTTKTLYDFSNPVENPTIIDITSGEPFSQEITVPSKDFNSNDIVITAEVEDRAGNKQSTSRSIKIDTTKPVISISYDNNAAQNEKYFKESREATVKIKERNYIPESTIVKVTADNITHIVPIDDVDMLKDIGITVAEKRKDSEEGKESYSDDRTNTYKFIFGEDGKTDKNYKLEIETVDTAGNTNDGINTGNSVAPLDFVVDEVAPELSCTFKDGNEKVIQNMSSDKNNPVYDQKSISALIGIKESNHNPNSLNVLAVGYDSSEKEIGRYQNLGKWKENVKYEYEAKAYDTFANYHFTVSYKDLAGNEAQIAPKYFTVDGEQPTGTLHTYDGTTEKVNDDINKAIKFGTFSNSLITVTQKSQDRISGISNVSYAYYIPPVNAKGLFSILTLEQLRNMTWNNWADSLSIRPNKQAVVYLRLVDKAGNIRYLNSKDGIIVDDVSPGRPSIEINAVAENEIYAGDVPFGIKVTDPESGGTYAGLKSVEWSVTSDGTETQHGNYNSELADPAARVQTISHKETVSAKANNSNNVLISVRAEDYAGNVSTASKRIAIDITAPKVSISYDNNSPLNGRYFNSARTMTVVFTERNFDPNQALLHVTINGESKTVPAGELAGTGISLVSKRNDSESGSSKTEYTDERTNTYVYSFGADGKTDADYSVTASITDLAGNTSSDVNYGNSNPKTDFTIDEIAPRLDMTFLNGSGNQVNVSTDIANPYYDRQSMTAIVNVIERNFAENGLTVGVSAQNAIGKAIEARANGEWTGSSDTHNYRIKTYTNDGIYTIEASFTDLAGNTTTYKQHFFVVDKTAPSGSIAIKGIAGDGSTINSIFEKFFNLIAFRIFTNKEMVVSPTSNDETSGVASVQYYLYQPDAETRGTFQGLTEEQLADVAWRDWSGPITIRPNMQTVVYAKITDKAGNVTYLNSQDGIVADDTQPNNPVITLDIEKPQNGIYNKDVPFVITVKDPEKGGTYAGLKSVSWTVTSNGKETQKGSYDSELTDPTARKQTITHKETIDAEKNNTNDVRITVETVDYAGNKARAEEAIKIDVTKPVIEVTYNKNDPKNELYYNAPRTATVKVTERNFDPSKVQLLCEETDKIKPTIGTWTGQSTQSDTDVHTCTVEFKEDGDYTFTVVAEDLATNKSDYARKDRFIIDTINPVVGVTYDRTNKNGGIYYNKTRTAIIVVKDKNFSERDFAYQVEGMLAGTKIDTPETQRWVHKNDMHSTMIKFEDDGDYSFNLVCTDLAGNASDIHKQNKFTIDKTKPVIKFSGVENHSANRGDVKPLIEYADINFKKSGIQVFLEGSTHDKEEVQGEIQNKDNSGSFQMGDFAHTKDVDDIYALTAEVTDLAGNKARATIEFSINRFGSVYTFSKDTESFLTQYYMKEPQELTIYETNIDGLKNTGVTVGLNGESTRLTEEDDYKTEKSHSEAGWTVLTYTLDKKNFTNEGLYEIKIESTDAAGNRQDNGLKEKPIAFAIDKTAPSVVVSGIDDKERYQETSKNVEITLNDNIAIGNADLMINGKVVESYDRDTIVREQGKLAYLVKGADEWQTISVVARDAAGNIAQSDTYTVFISNNKIRQFYENKPLFYGVIGGGAAALAALIAFILYKKKKDDKDGKSKTKDLKKSEDEGSGDLLK